MNQQLNTPFHDHLSECDQCRNGRGKLCDQGSALLAGRSYEMPEKAETAYCFTCSTVKPKSQITTREVTNKNGYKHGISRCDVCWDRRAVM